MGCSSHACTPFSDPHRVGHQLGFFLTLAEAWKHVPHEGLASLTDVEHVVFSLVVKNLSKEQIADMLGVSPHTVRHHREHVMTKLGAHSVGELCTITSRTGMVA